MKKDKTTTEDATEKCRNWPEQQIHRCGDYELLYCSTIRLEIITKLETWSRQDIGKIYYKIDTDSNVNLMPMNTFKSLFSMGTIEQWATHKDISVILLTYNKTSVS